MSGPKVEAVVRGWTMERDALYGYDGLSAERQPDVLCGGYVHIDGRGDLVAQVHTGRTSPNTVVPREVLVLLLRDAIARGVLTVEELTKP